MLFKHKAPSVEEASIARGYLDILRTIHKLIEIARSLSFIFMQDLSIIFVTTYQYLSVIYSYKKHLQNLE